MYLKSLEMIGFKSFAEKTKLEFEPGMTSIVGPNGCGKSNIADAIRWVLGEQSARALRGAKMEDVIFSGTDTHKPLGMAEVSLTLTDCERALETEYNEVTVTRRVLRSGEGQYFINRTPCRLKDIQRLFMDTGIGTSSYSLMEQGRIDQILSSRPDDRRAVFEEASGITKYKADKKEALRKLDHTEANLLRLDDIIREVRRQIISLQRQAGKARRYKAMQETLRGYDIFHTRDRLKALAAEIEQLERTLTSLREQEQAGREECRDLEGRASRTRKQIAETEQEIGDAMQAASDARSRLDRARESINMNRDRIGEFNALSDRDSRDADEASIRRAEHQVAFDRITAEHGVALELREASRAELDAQAARLTEMEAKAVQAADALHASRVSLVDLESRSAKLQNELADIEAAERTLVIRRERLTAEQAEMRRASEIFSGRQASIQARLDALSRDRDAKEQALNQCAQRQGRTEEELEESRGRLAELRTRLAATDAQIEMLRQALREARGFPGGARLLLDGSGRDTGVPADSVLGSLADHVHAEEPYCIALECVLRSWVDAVVVRDEDNLTEWLHVLQRRGKGSAKLLAAVTRGRGERAEGSDVKLPRLIDHVTCSDSVRPLISRLLSGVFVVATVADLPDSVPEGRTVVSRDGAVRRGDGSAEFWMAEDRHSNPLADRETLSRREAEHRDIEKDLAGVRDRIGESTAAVAESDQSLDHARKDLEESRHLLAVCLGESQVVSDEARQAQERLDTVTFELNALIDEDQTGVTRRAEIARALHENRATQEETRNGIERQTQALREIEQDRSALYSEVTDFRVRHAECNQRVNLLHNQMESLQARIRELDTMIEERQYGLNSYKDRITQLTESIARAEGSLHELNEDAGRQEARLEQAQGRRNEMMMSLGELDRILSEKRAYLDSVIAKRSERDVEMAEQRMRRQAQLERITAEHHLSEAGVMEYPEPEWEDGNAPDRETLETMVAELRAKLDSMGPVNLVAIDEHRELEDRYAFLTKQQDDLVKAKQQLMDLIRKINKTTTEMFSSTFQQVNDNFQDMFKRLFGGGTARLVLIDEEDILESGIEIIARPPGKRLQSVSLLSGGERTMTAVALLFALFMVKPSAFCVLDELDAALDDANIGRFVDVVKAFMEQSQFIVITHNRRTIGAADMLYGVTMEQRGVSSIVSVKFSDYRAGGDAAESAIEPTPQINSSVPSDLGTAV